MSLLIVKTIIVFTSGILIAKNKTTKLVADISLLKSYGFKTKTNEKYINF